jgi:hypothetical protein
MSAILNLLGVEGCPQNQRIDLIWLWQILIVTFAGAALGTT